MRKSSCTFTMLILLLAGMVVAGSGCGKKKVATVPPYRPAGPVGSVQTIVSGSNHFAGSLTLDHHQRSGFYAEVEYHRCDQCYDRRWSWNRGSYRESRSNSRSFGHVYSQSHRTRRAAPIPAPA